MKNLRKEGGIMPKAICKVCKKIYWGWALIYKECFCDCGYKLEYKKEEE